VTTIVTGGADFIGSHLVDRLLSDGGEVIAVDNFDRFYPRADKEANLAAAPANPRFRLVEFDIRDAEGVGALLASVRPDAIAEALGKPALIQALPEQPGDVRQTLADVSLAARELGYSPRVPFREGIRRYGAWYRSTRDRSG
jgi:nucleoside-diphosphate-sugar epimerase